MRYAQIRKMDISNGEGIGISLFVQGCSFHCKGCFNSETWDFNGGKEWTDEIRDKFIEMANEPYIKRISILGGEPLEGVNIKELTELVSLLKEKYPTKAIWLYTGHKYEKISTVANLLDDLRKEQSYISTIFNNIDVLVDGQYVEKLKDPNLKWRGSSNQRVIDIKETLAQDKVILYKSKEE